MDCKQEGESIVLISHAQKRDKVRFIYTVTCLYDIPPYCLDRSHFKNKTAYRKAMGEFNSHGGTRTFGWWSSLKKAKEAVENNDGDMHEYSYKYAVIEKTADGVRAGWRQGAKEYWYQWEDHHESGKYVPIEKPDALKDTVGWGIG